jgi:hypothetical protein
MDRQDDARPTEEAKDRPFAALDDDDAPATDDAAPVLTAAPLGAGMTGGPPGTLGTTAGAAETPHDAETRDASAPKP